MRVQFPGGTDPATVNSVMRASFSPSPAANAAPSGQPAWMQSKPVAAQPQWMQRPPVATSGNDDKPWLDYAPAPQSQADATRAAFNALPWYEKALTAADAARLVTNGATLGYAYRSPRRSPRWSEAATPNRAAFWTLSRNGDFPATHVRMGM